MRLDTAIVDILADATRIAPTPGQFVQLIQSKFHSSGRPQWLLQIQGVKPTKAIANFSRPLFQHLSPLLQND
jgi:hypothetical protein